MSVVEVTPRKDYTGDGLITVFPFDWYIVTKQTIEVLADGVPLLLDSDYTVTGAGNLAGGSVTILPAPASGVKICLLRAQPVEQTSRYQQNEDFPAARVEGDYDKLVMICQQLKETLGRALRFTKRSLLADPILPDGVAGKILAWKSTTELENISSTVFVPGAVTLPLSIVNGGTESATGAAARAALAVAGLADENTFTKGQHWKEGAAIASASTLAPGTDGNFFHVTGAVAITQIAASAPSPIFLAFDSTPVLTDNATKLILRDAANVTVAAGNVFGFVYEGGIIWREIFRSQTPPSTVLLGHLGGLGVSNNVTDPTNDLDIAVGEAVSDDALIADRVLLNAGAMTKRVDAVWAAGTNAGGLAAADNLSGAKTFHVWIFRRTGGVDDYFFSTSLTPTVPDSGTKKRRIGSRLWSGSAFVGVVQYGDECYLRSPVLDVDANNPGTAAVTRTLSVPTGIKVAAMVNVRSAGSATTEDNGVYLSSLDTTDVAASETVAPLVTVGGHQTGAMGTIAPARIWTDVLAQIRSRMEASSANVILRIVTTGWFDPRGRG